jgi:hypothetical protein
MCLHEKKVSPLQLVTHVIYDEQEVPNMKRMHIVDEEVSLSQSESVAPPSEEEEVPAPQGPTVTVPLEEEDVPAAPLVVDPPEGRRCLVPVPALVISSPFFFSKKCRRFISPFFLIHAVYL